MINKICPKCHQEKPIINFCHNYKNKDGFATWCKKCILDWQRSNKDKTKKNCQQCYQKYIKKLAKDPKRLEELLFFQRRTRMEKKLAILRKYKFTCRKCGQRKKTVKELVVNKKKRVLCVSCLRKKKGWARHYTICKKCHTKERTYKANGLCSKCYEQSRKKYKQQWHLKRINKIYN